MSAEFAELPDDLPVPEDDGAADHLTGMALPAVHLPSTLGGSVNLAAFAANDGDVATHHDDVALPVGMRGKVRHLVVYVYPRTGTPGGPSPVGWDDIPGARGCTPQSCAYRDNLAEFATLGARVVGVSTQGPTEQREFAEREHIPFALLSDGDLRLAEALRLPTFEVEEKTLYKRLTLVASGGKIAKVFYPVFPPDRDASRVLAWLANLRA